MVKSTMRRLMLALAVASFASGAASQPTPSPQVLVEVQPAVPLIEQTDHGQALNFDFRFSTDSTGPLELRRVVGRAVGEGGEPLFIAEINDNGVAPSILTVPNREVKREAGLTVFNPFHTLPAALKVDSLQYEFLFEGDGGVAEIVTASVKPKAYRQKTRLVLPLAGRVLVWDGHDINAHHRRLDFDFPFIRDIGLTKNSSRYSYDLVAVDARGGRYRGRATAAEDHFSFGAPVRAPGDGVVVLARDAVPDGKAVELDAMRQDLMVIFGNMVVIDHGNGEFSRLGHLQKGSLQVKVGESVRAGQVIARAGHSGSSLFPHLHYELADGPGLASEGLPVVFDNLERQIGAGRREPLNVSPDTGAILHAR